MFITKDTSEYKDPPPQLFKLPHLREVTLLCYGARYCEEKSSGRFAKEMVFAPLLDDFKKEMDKDKTTWKLCIEHTDNQFAPLA